MLEVAALLTETGQFSIVLPEHVHDRILEPTSASCLAYHFEFLCDLSPYTRIESLEVLLQWGRRVLTLRLGSESCIL